MKKIISIAIIFLVILFANTSFAASDQEIINYILENSDITYTTGTVRGGYNYNIPQLKITGELLKDASSKFGTNIAIYDGKIYFADGEIELGGLFNSARP